jgi:phosphoglucomutase
MLVCEMAADLKLQGKTILDALAEVYDSYGYFLSYVQSVELQGADAMEKAAALMTEYRTNVPSQIGGAKVTVVKDYQSRISCDTETGKETPINLPKSNVLEFILGEKGSLIIRPSGTEPKVKFYYTAVGNDENEAKLLLDAMKQQINK